MISTILMAPLQRLPYNLEKGLKKTTSLIQYKFMKDVVRSNQYLS
jgi:hypothetical protein